MAVDLKKIPTTPGIYKFFNKSEIIYIGKAINLKKRVSSYFGNSKKDRKTGQIKKLTDQIETFSTKNEVEALLLEQLLIRENKPKFNILLRDDKTYPYIFFSDNHNYPSIGLKRTKKAVDEKYFGPFVSSYAVKRSIKEIQKVFPLYKPKGKLRRTVHEIKLTNSQIKRIKKLYKDDIKYLEKYYEN